MKVLCVTGKRASGKTRLAEIAKKEFGFSVVELSSVVYEMMDELGEGGDVRLFSDKMRKKYGKEVFVERLWRKVAHIFDTSSHPLIERSPLPMVSSSLKLIVMGLRSKEEYEFLEKRINAVGGRALLLSIIADKKIRFERMRKRNRENDPKSWEEFIRAENIEDSWGLEELILSSPITIINNSSLQEYESKVRKFLEFLQ